MAKQSLSSRLSKLRTDTYAEIKKQMNRIGHTVEDIDNPLLDAFFDLKDVHDEGIVAISVEGMLIKSSNEVVELGSICIDFSDYIELAEVLQTII